MRSEQVPVVGTLQILIRIPWSRSLKDRRQVVRSVTDHARNLKNVSVADLGPGDLYGVANLFFAAACSSERGAEIVLDSLGRLLQRMEETSGFEIVDQKREVDLYDKLPY